MKERLRNVPVIGWLLRIQERFGEGSGTALANGIALQAFLSIFPLLILAVSVVGFVAEDDVRFTSDVVDALGVPPEDQLAQDLEDAVANARESKEAAGVIGLVGLLWTGLGVVTALQRSVDRAWQSHGAGWRDRARAVGVVLGGVLVLAASFALGVLINYLPGVFAPVSIIAGLAANTALFLWLFVALGRLPVGWRAHAPGALLCGLGLEVIKLIGALYVPRLVANSSQLYGSLGIVVAIIAWLALFGRLFVYGSVVNVVQWERTHGTLKIPLEVPRVEQAIALGANRSGAVVDRLQP